PDHHGGLGLDRRRAVGTRLVAVLLRPGRSGAGARPFDLASLSQGRGAGPEPARRPSASGTQASLCGTVSGRAFRRRGQATSGTIVAAAPTRYRCAVGSQPGGRPTAGRRLRLRPEAARMCDPRGAVVPWPDPAVPAVAAAPADAGIGAITAPIPTGARPTVGVPALRLAAMDELRRFGARKIGRDGARCSRR